MKLKGILLTSALTAMLGVGVFAGVSGNKNDAPVEATTPSGFNLYLDPGCWNTGGAGYAVWGWADGGAGKVYKFSSAGSTDLSYINLNSSIVNFQIFRMSPTGFNNLTNGSTTYPSEFNNSGDSGYWNRIPGNTARGSDNFYKVSGWDSGSWSSRDVASQDGYYLTGSEHSWNFDSGVKMTFNSDYSPLESGDIAVLYEYTAKNGEKIKVRSFKDHKDDWYSAGSGTGTGYGTIDKDGNFEFNSSAAGKKFDIFFNGSNFYLTLHKERYTVTVINKLYAGATYLSQEAGTNLMATETELFDPDDASKSGYAFRGWFTNEGCTTAYVPSSSHTAPFTLYAKFIRNGYYVISGANGWSIDAAVPMTTENISSGNNAEVNLTVAAVNETYSFVYYNSSNEMSGQTGLGATTFAVYEDNHVKFVKTGTYAIYLSKDTKVYINGGAAAFYTNFLNEVSAVCNTVGSEGYIASLQAEWANQKIAYNSLTESEQNTIKAVGFNGGSDVDDLHKVIKKYNRIVTKYGSAVFEDFIWGQTVAASSASFTRNLPETTETAVVTTTATVVTSVIAISTAAGFLFLKKKKNF